MTRRLDAGQNTLLSFVVSVPVEGCGADARIDKEGYGTNDSETEDDKTERMPGNKGAGGDVASDVLPEACKIIRDVVTMNQIRKAYDLVSQLS